MPRDPVAEILAAYPVLHHALRQRSVPTADSSISAHQATVLAQLEGSDGRTLTEVAAVMEVALPTMSLLFDRLVRAGLVERRRDPADGRRIALRLTDAGSRAVRGRSLIDRDRVRALLARLTPAERSSGVQGLATLARAAKGLKPNQRGRS